MELHKLKLLSQIVEYCNISEELEKEISYKKGGEIIWSDPNRF